MGSFTVLTDTTTEITGNFEFTGSDGNDATSTRSVTNGVFSVNIDQ